VRILVCVKPVAGELTPFDAAALEAALRVPNATVTVLSMCPAAAAEKMRQLTRLGVHRAVLLSDTLFAGSDTLATSYVLSLAAEKLGFDLVLCGRQSTDGDTAQVGPSLATRLGIALATNVLDIGAVSEQGISCRTRLGDVTLPLPALLTVERIHTLRSPSLFSKLGEVEIWDNRQVGALPARCGLGGSPTKVLKVFEPSGERKRCQMIAPTELVALVRQLAAKPRISETGTEAGVKLPKIVAVGAPVFEKATAIGEDVIKTENRNPHEIAALVKKHDPDAVLFPADLESRKIAPIVACLLETGLCADCTALETDGKRLFMYRPARSSSVIAKIECVTRPAMATVRVAGEETDVLVAGGRGTAENKQGLATLCEKLSGELAASRTLVDLNVAPYERQVGLTGKNAAAKVYVAVGISGAIQHTCALDGCGTVIAINPDKDARIFEHADFGIVATLEDVLNAL
jgi:electron transfer flavoprotein beta subunit